MALLGFFGIPISLGMNYANGVYTATALHNAAQQPRDWGAQYDAERASSYSPISALMIAAVTHSLTKPKAGPQPVRAGLILAANAYFYFRGLRDVGDLVAEQERQSPDLKNHPR